MKVFRVFNDLNAKLHHLQWIGWSFLALGASEPFAGWQLHLPAFVNHIRIGYIFGEQTVHRRR